METQLSGLIDEDGWYRLYARIHDGHCIEVLRMTRATALAVADAIKEAFATREERD